MNRELKMEWIISVSYTHLSCIPVPIKINPLDSPEELQKQIIEILSEAIKEKSRCDDGRIKDLIDNLNKIAEEVKKEIEDTLDITTDKLEENMKNIFPDAIIFSGSNLPA